MAAADGAGIYNVGTGVPTSVLDLHRLCAKTAGLEQDPRLAGERPGDIRHTVFDPARAERELGWGAETTVGDGLARTRQSVRAH